MGQMKSALENIYQAYESTENQVASASVKSDIAGTASATTATASAAATTAAATASGAESQSTSATATDSNSEYAQNVEKLKTDIYPEGTFWGDGQQPNENTYKSCQGCCAFAADFISYVYGKYGNFRSTAINGNSPYTDASQIQAGDVIKLINPEHWLVVLERNGDTLKVAEGNYLNSAGQTIVHYSTGDYKIQDGQLVQRGAARTIEKGFHYI
jgi:cytoskeletal protein RodZ